MRVSKLLVAVVALASATLFARDTAIYNGKLTSAMNANGMAITNAPTPVRAGDLVNKAYVDGIAVVTPAVVTNIANYRVDAKVAAWAMKGQPKPEGISPSAVTNIASSAAVTNAGAVASAKAYADAAVSAKRDKTDLNVYKNSYYPFTVVITTQGSTFTETLNFNREDEGSLIWGKTSGLWLRWNGDNEKWYLYNRDIQYGESSAPSDSLSFTIASQTIGSVSCSRTGTTSIVRDGDKALTVDGYVKPSDGIPSSDMASAVQTNLLKASTALQAVSSATANNFAALTSSGNLADSGCSTNSFAPAVEGGYLQLNGGEMNGNLRMGQYSICFGGYRYWIGVEGVYDNTIVFGDDDAEVRSHVYPDGTPIMTAGQADYHIVSNATVKSGQIANIDLTGLTNKTITVSFSTDNGKAGDALLWTAGNTADCTMTFSSPLTPHGDDGYLKASANKKCLFMFSKISATDIIITKKEIEQ